MPDPPAGCPYRDAAGQLPASPPAPELSVPSSHPRLNHGRAAISPSNAQARNKNRGPLRISSRFCTRIAPHRCAPYLGYQTAWADPTSPLHTTRRALPAGPGSITAAYVRALVSAQPRLCFIWQPVATSSIPFPCTVVPSVSLRQEPSSFFSMHACTLPILNAY